MTWFQEQDQHQEKAQEASGQEVGSISQELEEIFKQDQSDRKNFQSLTAEERRELPNRDRQRRQRVAEIISGGLLQTPADYYHAAMVYQHGTEPKDYLRAHILATASAIRGDDRGKWLSAAALDRYLNSVDQPQVFGTQYRNDGDGWTQEPFDRELIADALRSDFSVPSVEESASRLKEIEAMMQKNKK